MPEQDDAIFQVEPICLGADQPIAAMLSSPGDPQPVAVLVFPPRENGEGEVIFYLLRNIEPDDQTFVRDPAVANQLYQRYKGQVDMFCRERKRRTMAVNYTLLVVVGLPRFDWFPAGPEAALLMLSFLRGMFSQATFISLTDLATIKPIWFYGTSEVMLSPLPAAGIHEFSTSAYEVGDYQRTTLTLVNVRPSAEKYVAYFPWHVEHPLATQIGGVHHGTMGDVFEFLLNKGLALPFVGIVTQETSDDDQGWITIGYFRNPQEHLVAVTTVDHPEFLVNAYRNYHEPRQWESADNV